MPLTETNFIAGKMNKSVDERLIPSGEYIDAKDTLFNALHGLNVTSLDDFIPTLEIMEQLGEAFMKRTQYDAAAKDDLSWLMAEKRSSSALE